MGELSDTEWSRIYAFIWREVKSGNSSYKDDFEKDPRTAIANIDTALRAINPNLGLTYTTLFNIGLNPGLTGAQLDEIIEGKAIAFLQTRLTC